MKFSVVALTAVITTGAAAAAGPGPGAGAGAASSTSTSTTAITVDSGSGSGSNSNSNSSPHYNYHRGGGGGGGGNKNNKEEWPVAAAAAAATAHYHSPNSNGSGSSSSSSRSSSREKKNKINASTTTNSLLLKNPTITSTSTGAATDDTTTTITTTTATSKSTTATNRSNNNNNAATMVVGGEDDDDESSIIMNMKDFVGILAYKGFTTGRNLQQQQKQQQESGGLALNDPFERLMMICSDVDASNNPDENAYYYDGEEYGGSQYGEDSSTTTEDGCEEESFGEGGCSTFNQPPPTNSASWTCECPESFPPDSSEFVGSVKCKMEPQPVGEPQCYAITNVCGNGYGDGSGGDVVVSQKCFSSKTVDATFTSSWTGTYEHCSILVEPLELIYCLTYNFDGSQTTAPYKASSCEVSFNGQQCTSCNFIELFDSVQGMQYDCLDIDCINLKDTVDSSLKTKLTVCTGAYDLDLVGVTTTIGQSLVDTNLLYDHIEECGGCNVCYGNNQDFETFYMTKPSEMIVLEEYSAVELSCHELHLKAIRGELQDTFTSCTLLSEKAALKCGCTCGTKGQPCSEEFVNPPPDDETTTVPPPGTSTFSLGDCVPQGVNLECKFSTTFEVVADDNEDGATPTTTTTTTHTLANAEMTCPADVMGFLEVAKQPDKCQCTIDMNVDDIKSCDCYVCPSGDRVALSCPTNILPAQSTTTAGGDIGKECLSIDCSGNCISDPEVQFECVPFAMTEAPTEDSTFFLNGPQAEEGSKGKDETLYLGLSEDSTIESVALLTFDVPSQELVDAVYCNNKTATLTLNHVPIASEGDNGNVRTESLTYVPMRVYGVQAILGVDSIENFNGAFPLFEFQTTQAIRGEEFIVTPTQEIVEIDVSNLLTEHNAGSTRRRDLAEDAEKDALYILLFPVDTGTYGVGDSFYARENTAKGPSLSIAFTGDGTSGSSVGDGVEGGPPVVQPSAPEGAYEPILPDPEECRVYSDGNAMCPLLTKYSTGDGNNEVAIEARLLCPADELQLFEGDFAAASRNENSCTCAASLTTTPITDSDSDFEVEDPDVIIGDGDGTGDGDSENPTRRQLHAVLRRRMQQSQDLECECHICPDNGNPSSVEHKYAYTCTSPIVGECTSYDCSGVCNTPFIPTRIEQESPAAQNEEFTPNDCDKLTIGNFYFTFVNSIDPDEVAIFGFEDIPAGLELFLTDNAWNGIGFENNEGILQLTTPQGGIPAGTPFGYGPNGGVDGSGAYDYGNDWTEVASPFSLSQDGEQVFLFCLSGNDEARPIAAISYNGEFSEPGLPSYGLTQSALPASLADEGTIVLPHEERWEYQSKDAVLDIEVLKADIRNTDSWKGTSQSGAAGGFYGRSDMWTGLVALAVSSIFLF